MEVTDMNAENALGAYAAAKNESALADASPHKLITLLLDGASEAVATAIGAIQRSEVAATGEAVGKAMKIVESLSAFLDHDRGGEVAANLERLYEYMSSRMLEASRSKNPEILREVLELLHEIRAGWETIPGELRDVS
jgi:flagellar secretion chaperone FliS